MGNVRLYLDAQTIAAGNATKRNLLDVPTQEENDSLYVRSEADKKWSEHFEVKATKLAEWEQDKDVQIVTVQYKVTNEHYQKNAGRVMTKSYFLNTKAIKEGQDHKDYKRTMMNIGSLNQLIRACKVEMEADDNGRVGYHDYFDGEKPLVGKKFWGVVRDYTYKNRNDEIVPDQSIDKFLPDEA